MLALTPVTVRDTRDQPSSCPRVTVVAKPLCQGRRRVHQRRRRDANLLPLSARGLARDQSSRRSAKPPLQEESTVCRFHDILRSFTLQQCSCRDLTISAGCICDRRLQIQ